MAAQLAEVVYVRNQKEVREVLPFAQARALADYLRRVFRIEVRIGVAR